MKVKFIFIFVLFLLLSGVFYYKYPHLWKSVNSAKITYNGQVNDESKVYRSSNGEFLFRLKKISYVYFPESQKLGIPSNNQFYTISSFVFSKELPPAVIWADEGGKVATNPNLVVNENSVEFTNLEGERVWVFFGN